MYDLKAHYSLLQLILSHRRGSLARVVSLAVVALSLCGRPATAQQVPEDLSSPTDAGVPTTAPAPQLSSSEWFSTRRRTSPGYERVSPAGRHPIAFSRLATELKVSTLGYGLEVATPLTPRTNLRVAGNWFSVGTDFSVAGIRLGTDLHLRSARFAVDYQPFRRIGVQFTPGLLFYNANRLTGTATVAGGDSLTPGNGSYISSRIDPVTGSLTVGMDRIAPTFMVGLGNLLPRSGRHWSIPVEAGFAYTGAPSVRLDLRGSVCDSHGADCRSIPTAPDVLANIALEAVKLQNDLTPLSLYPIASIGIAYNFGSVRGFRNR